MLIETFDVRFDLQYNSMNNVVAMTHWSIHVYFLYCFNRDSAAISILCFYGMHVQIITKYNCMQRKQCQIVRLLEPAKCHAMIMP